MFIFVLSVVPRSYPLLVKFCGSCCCMCLVLFSYCRYILCHMSLYTSHIIKFVKQYVIFALIFACSLLCSCCSY
jgi:hypothetical protein